MPGSPAEVEEPVAGTSSAEPGSPLEPEEPAEPPASAAPASAAWTLPESELDTHRLFRVQYEGPEGEGSFRLTLRLEAADRYRARAVDLLGRPVWSLSFDRDRGLWIDHRAEVYCRLTDRLDLAGLPLAPFPLALLPPLLLGRVPEAPAAAEQVERESDRIAFVDRLGRRWTARLAAAESAATSDPSGLLASWTLWETVDPPQPAITWLRPAAGEEAILSDRRNAVQLRWRQVASQPLAEPLPAAGSEPPPPSGYERVACREAVGAAGTATGTAGAGSNI